MREQGPPQSPPRGPRLLSLAAPAASSSSESSVTGGALDINAARMRALQSYPQTIRKGQGPRQWSISLAPPLHPCHHPTDARSAHRISAAAFASSSSLTASTCEKSVKTKRSDINCEIHHPRLGQQVQGGGAGGERGNSNDVTYIFRLCRLTLHRGGLRRRPGWPTSPSIIR